MMQRNLAALSACLAASSPAGISAQETGTLSPNRTAQVQGTSANDARVTMSAFADCVVNRAQGRARKLLEMRVDTPEYSKQLHAMFDGDDDCGADGELRFSDALFRGSVSRSLYMQDFKSRFPASFPVELDSGYRSLYPATLSETAKEAVALQHLGDCVSRADTATTREFIRALPGSSLEVQMATKLGSQLGRCILQGEKIRFSIAMLKGVLAESMYRLSRASQSPAGAR